MTTLTPQRKKLLAAIIVPIQVVFAVFSWRDLSRRADDQIRGPKKLWRAILLVNPGNSLFYLAFGRRKAGADGRG